MRVAVREVRVEADRLEQLAHARARGSGACRCRARRIGSATMFPTVMRGLSDEYGSWKTICISRRISRRSLAAERRQLLAHEAHRAARRLQQLEDAVAGRRLARAGLADEAERLALARSRSETPSTAFTWSTVRSISRPLRTGNHFCRSATLEQRLGAHRLLAPPADGCRRARSPDARCARVARAGSRAAPGVLRGSASFAVRVRAARREAARVGQVDEVRRPAGDRGQPALRGRPRPRAAAARRAAPRCTGARDGRTAPPRTPARRSGRRT